jgi:RND family efflux transporter MFP subunit
MKRVVEAFHVAKNSENAAGLTQIILVVLVVLGTIGLTELLRVTADNGPGFSAHQAGLVVDVTVPSASAHTPERVLTGEVEARAAVTISPQVGGRVAAVSDKLHPGGIFAPGEMLFEIERVDYELALESAEADVAAAEADLLQTRATAENYVSDWYKVFPDKEPPLLVAKEPQVKAIEARLKAAKAQVKQAALNLERTRFSVHYPARIVSSTIERGQLANASAGYGSLYALDSLRITAGIKPDELARLGVKAGDTVTIKSEMDETLSLTAKVTQIGGVLDSRTRLRSLIITLPQDTGLVPGTFVRVTVRGADHDGIYRLPISALATAHSVWTVSGKALVEQPVDVVDMDNDYIYVRRFDPADGVVVTEGPTSFTDREVTIRKVLETGAAGGAS